MSSSSRSTSNSSIPKQRKMYDEANPCACGYPSRVWISTTEENPGKKFRTCPFSLDKSRKSCSYWKWVVEEDEEYSEMNLRKLEGDLKSYKLEKDKESGGFRQDIEKLKLQVSFQKGCLFVLFALVAAKMFL